MPASSASPSIRTAATSCCGNPATPPTSGRMPGCNRRRSTTAHGGRRGCNGWTRTPARRSNHRGWATPAPAMAYWPTPPAATYWSRERRLTTATNATRCRLHPNHRPRNEEIIMRTDSNLPMDLYKANVQLWMNMGLMMQEDGQPWAELRDKRLGDDIETTRKELEELDGVHGWKE